jgi:hypothetical protein
MKWEIEKRTKEVFNMGGVCKNIRDVKRLLTKQNTLAKKRHYQDHQRNVLQKDL